MIYHVVHQVLYVPSEPLEITLVLLDFSAPIQVALNHVKLELIAVAEMLKKLNVLMVHTVHLMRKTIWAVLGLSSVPGALPIEFLSRVIFS